MKLLLIRESMEIKGELSQGLGIIGTIAKEEAEISIIDNSSYYKTYSNEDFIQIIQTLKPDVIGFHLLAYNMFATSKLVATIKAAFPHIILIGGGLHTYSIPEEVLELGIHIVAIEEADLTILPLLRALQGSIGLESTFQIDDPLAAELDNIPGILFYHNKQDKIVNTGRPNIIQNLDELPFIDRNLFNLDDYLHKPGDSHNVTNTLVTQRGCPFSCSFCQGKESNSYSFFRTSSPAYRIKYIQYLWEQYKHDLVIFLDANFTMNKKDTVEFAKLLKESDLHGKVKFWCDTNVATKIDPDMLSDLYEAGCSSIAVGVERMTRDSLDKIGKNMNNEIFLENLEVLKQSKIDVTINTTIGYHFDTVEILNRERKHFEQLQKQFQSIMAYVVIPVPGTRIFKETPYNKWYMDERYANWKPPFYHYIYNFNGNGWDTNYFQLDDKTMESVRHLREDMHTHMIQNIGSNLVNTLFFMLRVVGKISFNLYLISPLLERIVMFPIKTTYNFLWKFMVKRYFAV